MRRPLSLQAAGPAVLIGFFAAAEAAARMLEAFPGSAFWWFVNLEVFRPLLGWRLVRESGDLVFHPSSLWIALALLGVLIVLDRLRARFALALAANLGAIATVATAYAWFVRAGVESASLGGAAAFSIDGVLVLMLLATSALAAAASHVAYLRPARRRRG